MTSPSPAPLAELTDVRKRYGRTHAVDGASFTVLPGEVLCVIGANGAGKSTLLYLLGGVIYADSGHLRVFGLDRWAENLAIRRQSTFCPAEPVVGAAATPREYIRFIAQIYGVPAADYRARLRELAEAMRFLPHLDKPWNELSLGMTRKANLIAAFLPPARLRILDEPFAGGIDPQGMETLYAWLAAARARGETIIFSTQVLDQADAIADRILLLHGGQTRLLAPPADLIALAGIDPASPRALARAYMTLCERFERDDRA